MRIEPGHRRETLQGLVRSSGIVQRGPERAVAAREVGIERNRPLGVGDRRVDLLLVPEVDDAPNVVRLRL